MNLNKIAEEYLAVADFVFNDLLKPVETVSQLIAGQLQKGGKLLICGNGGSAADAQHISGEMLNRFLQERRPYAAVALSTDTSTLTAIGNDYDYSQIFEKQVQALGRPEDVLIGISTSGNAQNVNKAVSAAKKIGMQTIGMTGGKGGALAKSCDTVLSIECTESVPRIQEGHQLVFHLFCERIEEIMIELDQSK